jgi:hypothetical protein
MDVRKILHIGSVGALATGFVVLAFRLELAARSTPTVWKG